MEFTNTIEDQLIKDQIITAMEGGSNYWYFLADKSMLPAKLEGEALSERVGRAVLDLGITVPVYDAEEPEDKLGEITKESISKALTMMSKDYPGAFADIVEESGDADTAVIFF